MPLIHLDIVADEIGRTTRTNVALWGDAQAGLTDLLAELAERRKAAQAARKDYVAEVPVRMNKWKDEAADRLHSRERPINMARMLTELNKVMPAEAMLVADGGFAGALDRFALRHQEGRPQLHRRPRAGLDRLRRAGVHRRPARRAGGACGRHDRRRRIQHDHRRAGDGAPLHDAA